jgi:hypothetical protein
MFHILQCWALICSAVCIACVGRKSPRIRVFGYVMCLLGAPVWFYHTAIAQQYGFLALSVWYGLVSILGLWEAHRAPKQGAGCSVVHNPADSVPTAAERAVTVVEQVGKPRYRYAAEIKWDGWTMNGDPGDPGTWVWQDGGTHVLRPKR